MPAPDQTICISCRRTIPRAWPPSDAPTLCEPCREAPNCREMSLVVAYGISGGHPERRSLPRVADADEIGHFNAMTDLTGLADGIALFRSGMEGVRGAFGLWRDIRGALPEGGQKEAVTLALEKSEEQFQVATAQIAKGLGYDLCMCAFPPTPMLTVGWMSRVTTSPGRAVHRCPRCGILDNGGWRWTPTAAIRDHGDSRLATPKPAEGNGQPFSAKS